MTGHGHVRDEASRYWNPERELRDPKERNEAALAQLVIQLERCYRLPFYRKLWDSHGFRPEQVRGFDDFTKRCPVVTKKLLIADQVENPPFGSYLGVPPTEICRIHGSSGTSGTPTIYGVSQADWDSAREIFALTHWAAGVRPSDIVHFAFPFGMFFGGWAMLYAAQSVGAAVFPMGAADTRRHVEMIYKLGCTVIEGTPSYLLHMGEVAREMGYDPAASPLRVFLSGGEPGGSIPSTRKLLLDTWGLQTVCDAGSSSEMFPFVSNAECAEMTGMHVYNDEVWTEIVDPDDPHKSAAEGEVGNLVYTHLRRESQPMIRFAANDRSFMTSEPCACGRTYPRLPLGLLGRADDMLVIRGANIFPSAVEHALRNVDGLGVEFRIRVTSRGRLDEIIVESEIDPEFSQTEQSLADLRHRAEEELKYRCLIRIPVKLVESGTFLRANGKARRVIDERELVNS
ncbi:phenylacetate--CoA ligase [Mycobacterium florentinum]|uniref:Phenylacetate--CoA ligase n=1 Tax=Mycobacterium florentinum TaxID=292462 RepID=A0A1X1U8K3_MYCFL|nr:AMP-binding protein [Mycobacterium florentinum]ORV53137.1 phenylacetate--CoA ligase [Mycobacterium florentinum]BBX79943.1 phenylacetate-coenzyme A ligase [Mycobacterium florentinum]